MTYTLEQVRDFLRGAPNSAGHVHIRPGDCADMADAIDFHLSQPQPVAQEEAVAWQCRGVMAGHFTEWQECEKEHYENRTLLTGWGDNEIETEFRELFTTPTIPTGYRLVPVGPTEECVPLDFSKPMETEDGVPVKYVCADVIEVGLARVCVDQKTGLVYSSPHIDLKIRNAAPTGGG